MKFILLIFLSWPVHQRLFPQSFLPVEVINSNAIPGKNISRTMQLLETSTTGQPNEVRIMIYGQSITRMEWWLIVREYLQQKYPEANINMQNYAIGGFQAERLIRCVERDLLDFYPDLIIFHDYGGEETYEKIISLFRKLTTAEVMILNDHMGLSQDQSWHDKHSWEWLPALCKRYDLEMVDVRTNWIRYAKRYGYAYEDFLRDHVHMNPFGNYLMAEIVKAHLVYDQGLETDPLKLVNKIDLFQATRKGKDNQLINLKVGGHRLDLMYAGDFDEIRDHIRIDGILIHEYPAVFIPSRAYINPDQSYPQKIGIPVKIDLSDKAREDNWQMVIRRVEAEGYRIHFDIYSDRDGFQGNGENLVAFCSLNGVLCLQPENWFYREEPGFFSPWKSIEVGDTVHFEIRRLNGIKNDPETGNSRWSLIGLPPGDHQLEIDFTTDLSRGKELILVSYDPPLYNSDQ